MKPEIRRAWNRLWRIANGEETVEQNLREPGFTSDLRDVMLALRASPASPAGRQLGPGKTHPSTMEEEPLPPGSEGPGGWRPIESAPIEQRIFLWCSDLRWDDERKTKVPHGIVFGTVHAYDSLPPRPQGEGMSGDWTFTHWQPLPEAPR